MRRTKVNNRKSNNRFKRTAKKTHRLNKASASAFIKRGGIRLQCFVYVPPSGGILLSIIKKDIIVKSNIQKNFAEIPSTKLPRSKFNRSFDVKTTFDAGYLIPVMLDEVLPGDRMSLDASAV